MIKIVTIIGARPQIIKAAALSRAIRNLFSDKIQEIIIHTGQHYDDNMSQVFFDELEIPHPKQNLNIGSASHARQTAQMLQGIEHVLIDYNPDFVVLYGDTNSTLAGALAASKLKIPLVHIEAGLRSFNKSMPEEINRIACDHVSTFLFVPTMTGIFNLEKEGFKINNQSKININNPGIFLSGDIMFDNLLYYSGIAKHRTNILSELQLQDQEFLLCTIHRDNNTDSAERLKHIFTAICNIAESITVVLPMHPRTSKVIENVLSEKLFNRLITDQNIHIIPPASYFEMITLEKNAKMILTDSGGVQKEAYFFNKPVIVARPETEWVEIINNGAGIVTDADSFRIVEAVQHFSNQKQQVYPEVFGNGHTAEFICKTLIENKFQ